MTADEKDVGERPEPRGEPAPRSPADLRYPSGDDSSLSQVQPANAAPRTLGSLLPPSLKGTEGFYGRPTNGGTRRRARCIQGRRKKRGGGVGGSPVGLDGPDKHHLCAFETPSFKSSVHTAAGCKRVWCSVESKGKFAVLPVQ